MVEGLKGEKVKGLKSCRCVSVELVTWVHLLNKNG
jgi:hypothetical protein